MTRSTEITAPDLNSKDICDILRACKKLNVKKINLSGCEIEFFQENLQPHPEIRIPAENMDQILQTVGAEGLPPTSVYANIAPEPPQPQRVTPADDIEIRNMIAENEMMMNDSAAWEEMQIDKCIGNDKTHEQRRYPSNDSAGFKAFDARRAEGIQ